MKNIAIIMGGYSSEYKISLISGNVVYQFLDKTKYQRIPNPHFQRKMGVCRRKRGRIPNR